MTEKTPSNVADFEAFRRLRDGDGDGGFPDPEQTLRSRGFFVVDENEQVCAALTTLNGKPTLTLFRSDGYPGLMAFIEQNDAARIVVNSGGEGPQVEVRADKSGASIHIHGTGTAGPRFVINVLSDSKVEFAVVRGGTTVAVAGAVVNPDNSVTLIR